MASSFFALFDDIASLLDDVAVLSKVAARQTTGVVGDDLALNAHQVAGIRAERELPVVWAVAKGSLANKAILVPVAIALSQWLPVLVAPLLMVGGLYLCLEGVEKLLHHRAKSHSPAEILSEEEAPMPDPVAFEREKIKGAVRTDFVLSAEILVIAMGTVAQAPLSVRIGVLCLVAVLMTVGVYGAVASIVKIDDLGLWMSARPSRIARVLGGFLVAASPWLLKALSVVGTLAMFLVGGGILVHGIPFLHHWESACKELGGLQATFLVSLLQLAAGLAGGGLALILLGLVRRIRARS